MNTAPKHGLTNRSIAMLLVITMTCVYVVGDNYAPLIANHGKYNSDDVLAQTLSYSTGLSPVTELRDVSDLVLAENTTNMGKASQSLSEAFAKMPKNVRSSDELDKSVADFSRQIAELKAQAIDELRETDNGSTGFSEYRDTVISGFNEVKVYEALGRNLKNPNLSESARTTLESAYQTAEDYIFKNLGVI